jgi:hypothetical protein
MRTAIRRHTGRSAGAARSSSSDRSANAWNVAATGAFDRSAAAIETLGANGSCTCTRSGRNSPSTRATAVSVDGRGEIGATDPL